MNWRKTIPIQDILEMKIFPHEKAIEIRWELRKHVKGPERDESYRALTNDFRLVRNQEEFDHALENMYKWAEDNMYWIG